MNTVIMITVGVLAGIAAGMGLGGGTVLLIYIALFTKTAQVTAQGINLLVFVPTAVTAVIIYAIRRQIEWKQVLKMAPAGVLGSLAGSYILTFLSAKILAKLLGILLLIMGITKLISSFTCKKQ